MTDRPFLDPNVDHHHSVSRCKDALKHVDMFNKKAAPNGRMAQYFESVKLWWTKQLQFAEKRENA